MTPEDPFEFAGKVIDLLRFGSYTATYKYAVLLALMDLCVEGNGADGQVTSITTVQLAERVVELYWPHTWGYGRRGVLRQNSGGQAEILTRIEQWRSKHVGSLGLDRARIERPAAFARLVREVEWKLVQMPLPKLQRVGKHADPFLFEIAWDDAITRGAWQQAEFDNRLLLRPVTVRHLVRIAPLLRPLIHREWAAMVAKFNALPEHALEAFLFPSETQAHLEPVRDPLLELQSGRCFYCQATIRGEAQVDHFIPRARHPDHGLDNLVVAHQACNGSKSDFIAHTEHLLVWSERLERDAGDLVNIAYEVKWPRQPTRTINVVRSVYAQIAADALLWHRKQAWLPMDAKRRSAAFERLRRVAP